MLFTVINSLLICSTRRKIAYQERIWEVQSALKTSPWLKVINNCCFLLNPGISIATVKDQHFPGNKTGEMLLVEWNFCRRCYQRPEAFDVTILSWLLKEAKRKTRD